MPLSRLILTTWNVASDVARTLLSNLVVESRILEGGDPLWISAGDALTLRPMLKDSKDPLARYFRQVTEAELPAATFVDFIVTLKELTRKNRLDVLEGRNLCFATDEKSAAQLLHHFSSIVVLLEPNSSATSFLYKLLKSVDASVNKPTQLSLVMVGPKRIEEAAQAFVEIRDDLTKHYTQDFDLHFAGFLAPDHDKLALATAYAKLLVEAFPEEGFHGQLKYVWSAIKPSVGILEQGSLLPILASLCQSFNA